MELLSRRLGLRLITVSAAIVAVAAVVVGAVVMKLSEDEAKARLLSQAEELANVVAGVATANAGPVDLERAVLATKLRRTGTAWILDREGRFVSNPDPQYQAYIDKCLPFGDVEIELTAVRHPLTQAVDRTTGNKVPLKSVVGRYESGIGLVQCLGEPHVVAFQVVPGQGWVVGVDEPYSAANSATASIKKYVWITCGVLGLAILLSTAISMAYIIKPYYKEKLELSERIERANRNLKKLHDVSVGMQKSLALEDRIHKILGAAHEVLGLDRIFIYLPNPEGTVLECKGAFGNEDEPPEEIVLPVGPGGGVIAQSYIKRKVFRVANAQELPQELRLPPPYDEIKALRSRAFVVLPMIVGNECVGVAALDNQQSKAPITDEIIEGLELFTSQAAVAIENATLYQQLRVYANELEITDHLTQLFTFFHFKKLLHGEIDRARVASRPLSLAVFSIDNFARYNELLGHKHGDDVLRQVAQAVRETVRRQDVIGRCFGSTFAVILPKATEEEARELAGTIQARLEAQEYPGQEVLPEAGLRFRVGVLAYPRGEPLSAEDYFTRVVARSKGEPV